MPTYGAFEPAAECQRALEPLDGQQGHVVVEVTRFAAKALDILHDATHELGGPAIQKASVYNVETFFGWVSTTEHFCSTFAPSLGTQAAQADQAAKAEAAVA